MELVTHKPSLSLSSLPFELLVSVLRYLEIHEIKTLQSLKWFRSAIKMYPQFILQPLYKEVFNIPPEQDLSALVRKIEKVWCTNPIIRLPFWGYHADEGVLYHSLPFWIGKAFLKTNKPIVGMSGMKSGSFSGCLSQDYYEFSGIVEKLSKLFRQVYETTDFQDEIDRIDLKTVIMEAFHSDLDDIPELPTRFKLRELKERLYNYAVKLNTMLNLQNGPNVLNEDVVRLPLRACIQHVELSREFRSEFYQSIRNCAQTLVIGVKEEQTVSQLEKLRLPNVASTNLTLTELSDFSLTKKLTAATDAVTYKYVLFKPNPEGLLLWLDFGKTLKVDIPIPFESRVWANEVHVCIVRGKNETAPSGLTFSYISFKGIMI